MKHHYTKGADRTSHGGAGSGCFMVGVGRQARKGLTQRKLYGGNPLGRTWHPKRVARALGTAKGLMTSEKARKKIIAEAAARHANDVPKGLKRISRTDPDTGQINVLDLPIDSHRFGKIMLLLQGRRDASHLAQLQPWQWDFLATGRYCPGK